MDGGREGMRVREERERLGSKKSFS